MFSKITRFSLIISIIFSVCLYAQLGDLFRAVKDKAESGGKLIFTAEFNKADNAKKAKVQESFGQDEQVYATLYTRKAIGEFCETEGGKRVLKFIVECNGKKKELYIEVDNTAAHTERFCFLIVPAKFDLKKQAHVSMINLLGELKNGSHDITVSAVKNSSFTGSFSLEIKGDNRFAAFLAEAKKMEAAEEARKEKERLEAEKRRQKIINDFKNASDKITFSIKNKCSAGASISVATSHEITSFSFSVNGNTTKSGISCRPGNKVYMGRELIRTISAADNGKVIEVCIPEPSLSGFKATWSGDDAWKDWTISTSGSSGRIKTMWSGDDAWKEWSFNVGSIEGRVKTMWSGDDAWKEWRLTTGSRSIKIKTQWSGDDAWKEWQISEGSVSLKVKTTWSGTDAWKQWSVSGPKGSMSVKTTWSGTDAWKQWSISDNMKDEDLALKFAAVFPVLLAGAVYNQP